MIKKLLIVFLLVVISQAPFIVHAGMHFPATASVDHSKFNGTATVEGFGNNTSTSDVSLHLFTNAGQGLTALCKPTSDPDDSTPPAPININSNFGPFHPDKNGKASFSFPNIDLIGSTTCGDHDSDDAGSVVGVKGTLFATYSAVVYSKKAPSTPTETATIGFQCTIDESVSASTKCVQIFETHQNLH